MLTQEKLDMKLELKPLYAPPPHPVLVEVPTLRYLMIDGAIPGGSPGPGADPGFREAIGALYGVTYTLKFEAKAHGKDFVVMPLEGLFRTEGEEGLLPDDPGSMLWTLMILQTPWVTPERATAARDVLVGEGKLPTAPALRVEAISEGRAAQILHVGPYAEERPTIDRLHAFIAEQGLVARSRHHEIYLSDPSRTAPERRRTIIRQPVAEQAG